MKYWMDDRLRMALLKEKSAYLNFWKKIGAERLIAADREIQEYYERNPDLPGGGGRVGPDPHCAATAVIHDFIVELHSFGIAVKGEWPQGKCLEEALEVLSPLYEIKSDILPFYFHQYPPVAQLVDWSGNATPEHDYIVPVDVALKRLHPWERLLRLDLRRNRKDILADVSRFLDRVVELRKAPGTCNCHQVTRDGRFGAIDWADNYKQWQPDVSRARHEAWRDLKIWRMRRGDNRKTFRQISRELKIRVDAAKKAFAHAYFLIEGRDYNSDKKLPKKVDKKELKRTCATCPEKPNCKDPCPDVLPFINEDYGSQRECLTSTGVVEFDTPRRRNKAKLADD